MTYVHDGTGGVIKSNKVESIDIIRSIDQADNCTEIDNFLARYHVWMVPQLHELVLSLSTLKFLLPITCI